MELEKIIQAVRDELPEHRFAHTERVVKTALKLADIFGGEREKIKRAGYLHDYCKYWSTEQLIDWIRRYQLPEELLQYNKELWHGPVGAKVAQEKFDVVDVDIQNAIFYHTSGRPEMSHLEKLIFIADYIEPGRNFPGVEQARDLAQKDLDEAILYATEQTILFLIQKQQPLYPLTILTRNAFLQRRKSSGGDTV